MKYIASIILMLSTFSQPSPGISAVLVFLFISGAVGWALYILSSVKVRKLKAEIEILYGEVVELQRSHDENLKKIRALEASLRNACVAIDKLTQGMDKINKMFDDGEDETLS